MRSSTSSFNWQYPLVFSRSCCSCLCLLPHFTVTSILPSFSPSITCIRFQFLRKMWPLRLAHFVLLFVGYPSRPWLVILLHFPHDRVNWSPPSFSNTTFQNVRGISCLFNEVSNIQHHAKLYSKCTALLASSFNLGSVFWRSSPRKIIFLGYLEYGDSKLLWNVGNILPVNSVSYHGTPCNPHIQECFLNFEFIYLFRN